MPRAQGATAQRGLALGIDRVRGGQRVEDGLRSGVPIGTRAISLGVQFRLCLPRSVAAADEHPDGLVDD